MVAPGFSAKLKEKKTEDKQKSKEKAKSEKTEATSQKKTSFDSKDSNSKGEGEKVDQKNEDFEEVYHKSESEDKNGDGRRESEFQEVFHEAGTEETNKDKKIENAKKEHEQGIGKNKDEKESEKTENFTEVFHTTPGNQLKYLIHWGGAHLLYFVKILKLTHQSLLSDSDGTVTCEGV